MYKKYDLPKYITKQDKELIKLNYETKKYKTKKESKVKEISEFTTLEEAIDKNIQTFENKKKKRPKNKEEIEQEEIDYILNSVPFIREMYSTEKEDEVQSSPQKSNRLFEVKSVKKNSTIFQNYLFYVEKVSNDETLNSVSEKETFDEIYTCSCGGSKNFIEAESILVCSSCGFTENFLETYSARESNETMAYKRSNHLIECLNALQGKEGTTVPPEVIDAVRAEFKKNRISSSSEIKPSKVKQFLKKLGFSAYYDNIYSITNVITGLPTLKLSKSLEKKFRDMFNEIQEPFERHKPPERKNFLSYKYVLYKFSELLGEDELLPYFSLLKCRQNLHAQDVIWRKICEDLRWEYIPTV